MSLRDRLFNVAKAEIKDAARKLKQGVGGLLSDEPDPDPLFDEGPRFDFDDEPVVSRARADSADVRRWYANLELPIGADLEEVKAAYRRLMRRYHPDKHHTDTKKAEAATQLAQRLREAYDGLTKHLSQD